MFKIGTYYLITDYNYAAINRKVKGLSYYVCEVGDLYQYVESDGDYYIGRNKWLKFFRGTLKELVTEYPDAEVTSLVWVSPFNLKARKFETELQETIAKYRQNGTKDKLETRYSKKLLDFTEEFSEPLFTQLLADENALESMINNIRLIRDMSATEMKKYTVLMDVVDEYNKRQKELEDIIWVFTQKQRQLKLELLNNKADQMLEKG
jgi:hypothetical protein